MTKRGKASMYLHVGFVYVGMSGGDGSVSCPH